MANNTPKDSVEPQIHHFIFHGCMISLVIIRILNHMFTTDDLLVIRNSGIETTNVVKIDEGSKHDIQQLHIQRY